MTKTRLALFLGVALISVTGLVQALTISINFIGSAGDTGRLSPDEFAGNFAVTDSFVPNWNNVEGDSGSDIVLLDASGLATEARMSFSSPLGIWSIPNTMGGANSAGGANPVMMKGYLDADENGSTVNLSGLRSVFVDYMLLLYFDGNNNNGIWRKGEYSVRDGDSGAVLFRDVGEDSEYVDFNSGTANNADGVFQIPVAGGDANLVWPYSPNNAEGNFFVTGLLSANAITISSIGTETNSSAQTRRAPLNGLQIIGEARPVSAPGSLALIVLGVLSAVPHIRKQKPISTRK